VPLFILCLPLALNIAIVWFFLGVAKFEQELIPTIYKPGANLLSLW
jgi:hypothetical protein